MLPQPVRTRQADHPFLSAGDASMQLRVLGLRQGCGGGRGCQVPSRDGREGSGLGAFLSGGEGKEGTRVCGLNFLINSPWPLGLGPEEAAASALGGF